MTTRIAIQHIVPNPKQPRKHFDDASIAELADSIRQNGLIQPIVVEPADHGYTLVSGERRLRALQLNGVKVLTVGKDVIIQQRSNHDGRELLIKAIVENVQREDMNPIETAQAFAQLRDAYGLKPPEIAKQVGKAATQVYAQLELLEAEPEIQKLWAMRQITHEPRAVKAILGVPAGAMRIALVEGLAKRHATGKMIRDACARYNELQPAKKQPRDAQAVVRLKQLAESLPEWDALFQLGKVPPWPLLNDSIMHTCDNCALRSVASEAVCGGCALVAMLDKLLEVAHGAR